VKYKTRKGKERSIDCRHLSLDKAVYLALSIGKRSTTANFFSLLTRKALSCSKIMMDFIAEHEKDI
jgi:hypothetical protein